MWCVPRRVGGDELSDVHATQPLAIHRGAAGGLAALASLQTALTYTMHVLHLKLLLCIGTQLELRQRNREASLAAIRKVITSCYILAVDGAHSAPCNLHERACRQRRTAETRMGRLPRQTAASSQVWPRSETARSNGAARASPDTALLSPSGKQKKARAVTLEEEASLLKFYQTKMQVRGAQGQGSRLSGALSPKRRGAKEAGNTACSQQRSIQQALRHRGAGDTACWQQRSMRPSLGIMLMLMCVHLRLSAVPMHVATCQRPATRKLVGDFMAWQVLSPHCCPSVKAL